jgi:hypothetical protein
MRAAYPILEHLFYLPRFDINYYPR